MFLSQLTFYDICLVMVVGYAIVGWLIPLGIKINYGRLKNPFFKT